jgi:hypothetical protein
MANIALTIGKDIEVGAEDLLKWITKGTATVQGASPSVLAALGTLAGGVEKILADATTGAQNPLEALVNAPAELTDLKAAWPEVKTFLATLGIKV